MLRGAYDSAQYCGNCMIIFVHIIAQLYNTACHCTKLYCAATPFSEGECHSKTETTAMRDYALKSFSSAVLCTNAKKVSKVAK